MEKLWSLGGRYPYRCYECQTRFYAFKVKHTEDGKVHAGDAGASPGETVESSSERHPDGED